jgi:hypothetical protein
MRRVSSSLGGAVLRPQPQEKEQVLTDLGYSREDMIGLP